jgi:hypothetical protein
MFYFKRHGWPIWDTYNLPPSKQITLQASYLLEMEEVNKYLDEHKDDMFINPSWLTYYSLPDESEEKEKYLSRETMNLLKRFADKDDN